MAKDFEPLGPPEALTDEAHWTMDGDNRYAMLTMRPALVLHPTKVAFPFAMLKETVAQIMIFECGEEEHKLEQVKAEEGDTKAEHYRNYLASKRAVAMQMLKEARTEQEGRKVQPVHISTPEAPKQIPGFDV